MSPVVKMVILVIQTKEIWRDFTRFAIISKPKIQITKIQMPIILLQTLTKLTYSFLRKKCYFNDALLLTHAVYNSIARVTITKIQNDYTCRSILPVMEHFNGSIERIDHSKFQVRFLLKSLMKVVFNSRRSSSILVYDSTRWFKIQMRKPT